ncbi:MAG: hypothetical protein ACHQ7M_10175 [Chloroflexota bacterium]
MQEPQPIEPSLERLYEEPHSVRERHLGLMFRGEEPPLPPKEEVDDD